jgi:hypothetical protein
MVGESPPMSVRRPISRSPVLPSPRQSKDPSRRVGRGRRDENRYPLIEDGEHGSPECRIAMRVEASRPFDQKHWESARSSQASDLTPQSPVCGGDGEIRNRLALDQGATADVVVSRPERCTRHLSAEVRELVGDTASPLIQIHHERRLLHEGRLAGVGLSSKVALLASSGTEEA